MPGFNINSGGDGDGADPGNNIDLFRNHRWRILELGENLIYRGDLLFAKSIQLPAFSVEEEVVMGAAIKYKFAKSVNWEDIVITFYDNEGLMNQLLKWQKLVHEVHTGIKLANVYKKTSSFELIDGAGKTAGLRYYLINSWPKSISHSQLSYEDSEIKLVNMTLSYDWAEINDNTASGG